MTILQGYDGELRISDYGLSGTTYHLEVLFCEMDFTGPVARPQPEETLILDRGRWDTEARFREENDLERFAAMPFSFSCRLADTVNTQILVDWISGVTQIANAASGTTQVVSWGGGTSIQGRTTTHTVPNFSDAAKSRYRLEILWDGSTDLGLRYEEAYFNPTGQTITESPDGLMLSCNGEIYGDVTRITAFYSGSSISAFS